MRGKGLFFPFVFVYSLASCSASGVVMKPTRCAMMTVGKYRVITRPCDVKSVVSRSLFAMVNVDCFIKILGGVVQKIGQG